MKSTEPTQESAKFKTREEIADEYGIHRRTLYRRLKALGITLSRKLLSIKDQKNIYAKLGKPKDMDD